MSPPPSPTDPTTPDPVHDRWRAALWLLQALPPTRRGSPDSATTLRRRKMRQNIRMVSRPNGVANQALYAHVVPDAPFIHALMWWLVTRGVEDEALHGFNILQAAARVRLLGVAGSPRNAHAVLLAFARARVAMPDTAFSDAEIRAATVRELIGR
jgi:hypothetical protein